MAELTDAEIEAAIERGRTPEMTEPRAQSARYDVESGRLVVTLQNGSAVTFRANLLPGLASATSEQLAEVRIEGDGYALRWEALDVDLAVPCLEIEPNEAAPILGIALPLAQHRIDRKPSVP